MPCPVCDALASKRDRLWREYVQAVGNLLSSGQSEVQEYAKLRASADKPRTEFSLAETALRQHQDRHAVPH